MTNLGGVMPTSLAGTYQVTLTLKKADSGLATGLTKIITVTATMASLASKNYLLSQRPANDTAIPIVAGGSTVAYKFKGQLFIESGPSTINFASKKISVFSTKVDTFS